MIKSSAGEFERTFYKNLSDEEKESLKNLLIKLV